MYYYTVLMDVPNLPSSYLVQARTEEIAVAKVIRSLRYHNIYIPLETPISVEREQDPMFAYGVREI